MEDEQRKAVCRNPWCKATFIFTLSDMKVVGKDESGENILEEPKFCKKCQSFDKELSGGVEWKDKEYKDEVDSKYHQIKYKINRYR